VGNFLIVVPSRERSVDADRLFREGVRLGSRIKGRQPGAVVETDWASAASFSRRMAPGPQLVVDPATESWLIAIGTWFHADGYGLGAERQLLDYYLRAGQDELCRALDGFFVVAIGDARAREVIAITDVNGSCHCYTRSCEAGIAVSTSSLLLAGLGPCDLDPVGYQEFLCTGTIYEDRTLYRQVRKLGAATVFRFAGGAISDRQRYWQVDGFDPEGLDGRRAVTAAMEALTGAARNIGRVFSRPVCDLTGGYDSRVLVAAFLNAGVGVTTTVAGSADSSDVVVSDEVARVAGLPHVYLPEQDGTLPADLFEVTSFTDGEVDPLEYGRILRVHRALAQRHDISINGSYGGVARGLWWEILFPRIGARQPLDTRTLARLRYVPSAFDAALFPPEIRLDFTAHFAGAIERINAGLAHLPNTMQMDHANLSMRIHRWQGRIASSTNQLWPCLSPFGLRSVLETVLQTSARLRLRSLLVRRMLAAYQPRLASVRLDRGYPPLPLTWTNAYRFWRLPVYFGRRVLSKGIRTVVPQTADQPTGLSPRLRLWDDDAIRALLDVRSMRAAGLLSASALGEFLSRSREPRFPFTAQWSRLLSVEMALGTLDGARKGSA
jgi:asparagine synthase (glutamine-hydrolysing)